MSRLWMTVVTMALAVVMTGCAANQDQTVTPVQETAAQAGQTQPNDVRIHDIKQWYFAGAGNPLLVEQTKPGQMDQPTGVNVAADAVSNAEAAKAQLDDPNGFGKALAIGDADAKYVLNVINLYRAWNDSSVGAEQAATATQTSSVTADLSQTVRVVLEAALEVAQGLLTQQGMTQGQAAEGSTADATGGAQQADLKVRLERLISVLENAVLDPNAAPAEPATP